MTKFEKQTNFTGKMIKNICNNKKNITFHSRKRTLNSTSKMTPTVQLLTGMKPKLADHTVQLQPNRAAKYQSC